MENINDINNASAYYFTWLKLFSRSNVYDAAERIWGLKADKFDSAILKQYGFRPITFVSHNFPISETDIIILICRVVVNTHIPKTCLPQCL